MRLLSNGEVVKMHHRYGELNRMYMSDIFLKLTFHNDKNEYWESQFLQFIESTNNKKLVPIIKI